MKAIIWSRYGPPEGLALQEVAKPVPKDDQVLIRIMATSVTAGDCEMRRLQLPLGLGLPMRLYMGLARPRNRILGQELAGIIEAVGKAVTGFSSGDPVFGVTGFGFGAYAEYICLSQDGAIAIKPANMSFEEAAAVPTAGLEVLHFMGRAGIRMGEKVLIIGAGGSIGTVAVQLARQFGAQVVAVDSAEKLAMLRELGAEQVIDYTREDFTREAERYDIVFDVPGRRNLDGYLRVLKPGGRLLLVNPRFKQIVTSNRISRLSGRRIISGSAPQTRQDLEALKDLIEAGRIKTVIDRSFPLEQMRDAHRYAESGQKKGNIAITVGTING